MPALGIIDRTIELRAGGRWYDITIVSDNDSGFLRRLAGHVENGQSGVSDPAVTTG